MHNIIFEAKQIIQIKWLRFKSGSTVTERLPFIYPFQLLQAVFLEYFFVKLILQKTQQEVSSMWSILGSARSGSTYFLEADWETRSNDLNTSIRSVQWRSASQSRPVNWRWINSLTLLPLANKQVAVFSKVKQFRIRRKFSDLFFSVQTELLFRRWRSKFLETFSCYFRSVIVYSKLFSVFLLLLRLEIRLSVVRISGTFDFFLFCE